MKSARKLFRKLAKKLKGRKKKNGDKKDLINAMSRAFTTESLAKFIINEGLVNKLAKSRIT